MKKGITIEWVERPDGSLSDAVRIIKEKGDLTIGEIEDTLRSRLGKPDEWNFYAIVLKVGDASMGFSGWESIDNGWDKGPDSVVVYSCFTGTNCPVCGAEMEVGSYEEEVGR